MAQERALRMALESLARGVLGHDEQQALVRALVPAPSLRRASDANQESVQDYCEWLLGDPARRIGELLEAPEGQLLRFVRSSFRRSKFEARRSDEKGRIQKALDRVVSNDSR